MESNLGGTSLPQPRASQAGLEIMAKARAVEMVGHVPWRHGDAPPPTPPDSPDC